ncbi:MAG: hypothetical protein UW50_C0003G0002 [Candidatus Wolfebacteria bacterium GW2011_GWA1_44_24]|nr:MAG: hypothetical protein UW50_C0003G0002 [Candidatus Wolfebacteria bacterium GW2011_GWA1_44_24]
MFDAVEYNKAMRQVIILSLFLLLTPFFWVSANESGDPVCLFSVPSSVFKIPEVALTKAKDSALGVVKAVPEGLDSLADSLADKLEATKKVPESGAVAEAGEKPQVLGASTSSTDNLLKAFTNNNLTASAYSAGIDIVSILLRNWMWTLSGLAVLALFWTFKH